MFLNKKRKQFFVLFFFIFFGYFFRKNPEKGIELNLPQRYIYLPWPSEHLTAEDVALPVGAKVSPSILIMSSSFEEFSCWAESSSSANPKK